MLWQGDCDLRQDKGVTELVSAYTRDTDELLLSHD